MKRVKSIRGVEIHRTKSGTSIIYLRYQANGRQFRERVGPSAKDQFGKDETLIAARKLLKERRSEIHEARMRREPWLSPKERKQLAAEEAVKKQDGRRELLFEVAVARFLNRNAKLYARPEEIRSIFENRLAKAFAGRYLDEITPLEIRDYTDHRLSNSGSFSAHKKKVGQRTPETELTKLSALYTYLIEEEQREIKNPCSRPRAGRRKRKKSEVYRPKRKPVIPSRAAIRALFDAAVVPGPDGGQPVKTFKALFQLFYYTAGRPESEPCQLRHGDVTLPDRDKVRTMTGKAVLGSVTFRHTKTGVDRTIPLNPEAEADLRALMKPRPDDPKELEDWTQLPIFRKRGSSSPMDRNSYRKAWTAAVKVACKEYPELAGMVPRDFRKTSRTMLTNAQVPEPTIRRIMGHSLDVSQGYHELTEEAAEQAILTLSLEKPYTRTVHRDDDNLLSEPA